VVPLVSTGRAGKEGGKLKGLLLIILPVEGKNKEEGISTHRNQEKPGGAARKFVGRQAFTKH